MYAISGFDPLNGRIVGLHPGMHLRVEDALDIPLGSGGVKVRAIVELHPLSEVEDPRPASSWTSHKVASSGTTFHSGGGVMVRRE